MESTRTDEPTVPDSDVGTDTDTDSDPVLTHATPRKKPPAAMLSEVSLRTAIQRGDITIESAIDEAPYVEASSIDLHLGHEFRTPSYRKGPIDVMDPDTYSEFDATHVTDDEGFLLGAGDFALAHTEETVSLSPNVAGVLYGRSSVGRLGLFVENAGLIDAGFSGQITLELFNARQRPVRIYPEMRICQITVHRHDQRPMIPYEPRLNKYQGQLGATPSRLHMDFDDDEN